MMVQPHFAGRSSAQVFAVGAKPPFEVLEWDEPAVILTGVASDWAIGKPLSQVLGVDTEVLVRLSEAPYVQVPWVGMVMVDREDDRLRCHAKDLGTGADAVLTAHELRVRFRKILSMAEMAQADLFAAEALLVRIKQVARQGLAETHQLLSRSRSPVRRPARQNVVQDTSCRTRMGND